MVVATALAVREWLGGLTRVLGGAGHVRGGSSGQQWVQGHKTAAAASLSSSKVLAVTLFVLVVRGWG
jgi:hypothetical protein